MTYANPTERRDLIAGLRALADSLENEPQIPVPFRADLLVFPPDCPDEDGRAEIDRIAALMNVPVVDLTAEHCHYTASRRFGPVEYRAVFIPSGTRAYYAARASYSGNVIPEPAEEA